MKIFKILILLFSGLIFIGCASKPEKAEPVANFELEKYLGKWYEIARIDFKFEENLNNTTAEYSLNSNGSVKVLNKGYNYVKKEWQESEGVAKFRNSEKEGALEVSFFGPFYSGYNVLAIENDYKYVLVGGKNLDYLWILSRENTLPDNVKTKFLDIASKVGYDTNRLIWVEHNK